jgi:hypothetical protein
VADVEQAGHAAMLAAARGELLPATRRVGEFRLAAANSPAFRAAPAAPRLPG